MTATGDKGGYDAESVTVEPDTRKPTASIYHYPDALPTDQSATLVGWGSDNVAVDRIELLVDGTLEKTCSAPFPGGSGETKRCAESGITLAEGLHTIKVRVYDLEGNVGTATSQLAAFQPGESPTITLTHTPLSPNNAQPVQITVRAEDNQGGIETLLIQVNDDGPAYLGQDYDFYFTAPFSNVVERTVTFTPTSGKRIVKYEALAFDGGDQSTRTDERTILVDNGPPDSDDDGIGDSLEGLLCTSANNPDTDRDGLRDGWEILGLDFPDGDRIDLHAMGADPCREDVFVQYDYERGTKIPDSAIQSVINTFQDHYVTLHVESNERPHSGTSSSMTSTLKADDASYATDSNGDYFFDPKRNWTHYYVYSHHRSGRSSMWNHVTIDYYAGNWNCPPSVQNPQSDPQCQQGRRSRWDLEYRFIHELGHDLGHDLGMGHGGREGSNQQKTNGDLVYYEGSWDNTNYKPHYLSVMNYRYNRGNLCYNPSNGRFVGSFDYQDESLPTLDESDLDEQPDSTFAVALRNLSCDNSSHVPAIVYTCTDPDEQDDDGNDVKYQMLTDGQQTLARKSSNTNGFTTTVPSHANGIDWNCDGQIESSVSENVNDSGGQTLTSRDDWLLVPTGQSCLLGDANRISRIGYPSAYVNDAYGPPCSSKLAAELQEIEPIDPVEETDEEEAILDGLPNFELCDGQDNDGDGTIDEGCLDSDADAVVDAVDNCPLVANADQADDNGDFRGNACDGRPGEPVDLQVEATEEGVLLTWEAPASGNPTAYNVYRRVAGTESYQHVGGYPTTEVLSYTDSGSIPGGEHRYMVRTLNRYAEEGDASFVNVTTQHGLYLPLVLRSE